jgi:hypothetical protein
MLPAGCPSGTHDRTQTVAFVAEGHAWTLDPASGDLSCVFAVADPEPFTWSPRGDRALLSGLAITSILGTRLRTSSSTTNGASSWGHPIGKAVVYISAGGTSLRKIYPGTQRRDDITPIDDVRYLNVIYHPSGLALAFVIDTGDGQQIWLSSNRGEDPVRLVFATEGTTFGALGFTADGRMLLYAATHGESASVLHGIDLTNPTANQALWRTDADDLISSISTQPSRDGALIAVTVGSTCEDSRALVLSRGESARSLGNAPSRVVGWLDDETVLVASGACAGPSNLSTVDVLGHATVPLVSGVAIAAARTPLLDFVPTLPPRIEQEVGEGVG